MIPNYSTCPMVTPAIAFKASELNRVSVAQSLSYSAEVVGQLEWEEKTRCFSQIGKQQVRQDRILAKYTARTKPQTQTPSSAQLSLNQGSHPSTDSQYQKHSCSSPAQHSNHSNPHSPNYTCGTPHRYSPSSANTAVFRHHSPCPIHRP